MRKLRIPLPEKGTNNRQAETSTPHGQVRDAVNVNLDVYGNVTRRAGYRVLASGATFHSIYEHEGRVLVGVNRTLAFIDPDTLEPEPICDLTSKTPLVFARHGQRVYATNGADLIQLDGPTAYRVTKTLPVATPQADPNGTLPTGEYGVVVTAVQPDGTDSAGAMHTLTLDKPGGIRFDTLPADRPDYRVYLTAPGGEELYLADTIVAGFGRWVVGTPAKGAQYHELGLEPLPAGSHLTSYLGRLYVGDTDWVYYSEPQAPTKFAPGRNWIRATGLRFVAAVEAGLVIANASGTWLHRGDPHAPDNTVTLLTRARAAERGALPVSGAEFGEPGEWLVWLTEDGFALLSPNGEVQMPQRGMLRVDVSSPVTLSLHRENGQARIAAAADEAAAGDNTFNDTKRVQ